MHDFDADRAERALSPDERRFRAGGREWMARSSVRPETLARFNDLLERIRLRETVGDDAIIAILDDVVRNCIEQDASEWDAAREQQENTITLEMLWAIASHCTRSVSGRPLPPPSDSGDTPSSSGTPSTPASSSQEAQAPAAST